MNTISQDELFAMPHIVIVEHDARINVYRFERSCLPNPSKAAHTFAIEQAMEPKFRGRVTVAIIERTLEPYGY